MSQTIAPENMLAVGVDPSKDTLGIALIQYPESILFNESLPNLPEGFAALERLVAATCGSLGLQPAFGLEDTGRYGRALCEFLCARNQVVKEVNPILTHRQRAFYGQDKTDGIDAICAGVVLMRRFKRLPGKTAGQDVFAALSQLSTFRESQVKIRTQMMNQLHDALTHTYGNVYQRFFSNFKHTTPLVFFRRYPTAQQLKTVKPATLDRLLAKTGRGHIKTSGHSILQAAAAVWSQPADAFTRAMAATVECLCDQILALNQAIGELEKKIRSLVQATDIPLTSMPGVSWVRAGVILGCTANPLRFHSKHAFAKYNGTAPSVYGSGRFERHVSSWACNRRLRQELHQLALYLADHDSLSGQYVQRHVTQGKTKGQSVNRLARRVSDILFAIMVSKRPYDPSIAQANMEKKQRKTLALTS